MISDLLEYEKARGELLSLEQRLHQLEEDSDPGMKGFTKAGVRKMIARLHEELAVYEGSLEASRGVKASD